ncbi:MAG: ATP/GTP-binding protein [Candidatus Thiodiazotropha taylori]|nr:ATP/GTP-binding protein [Candidatus Thiodiazotropha taylori]MCG7925799.1 ATP/GTP-binding protein [Candidatus Thiodiazotropha taylori]MCG7970540.1 ATP/GTP-binding protein [Candidatus Thiodiazotropha taylori]MCG8035516.1 ATP/GTP-binding protein [Candidatus Thiodiazotropha taylori]MCG8069622.1 ATP/GTP-binding protein [Candidatus Thiodiazotropha taylori]
MSDYKIIFSGPVGAGKTTAIQSISDILPVTTDEQASDMTRNLKNGTTVAMDYGLIKLPGTERIHLYGTPGQERFDFMWEILSNGGIGLVLLINNQRPDPFGDLHFFLNAFQAFIKQGKVVIGVTQMDQAEMPRIEDYHLQLENSGVKIPVFDIDARIRKDVSILLEALLYSLDPGIEE